MRTFSTPHNAIAFLLIALAGVLLYSPFLQNQLVFDDATLFGGRGFATVATTPWELPSRGLPYFTIAFLQVDIGSIELHRTLSIVFHTAVAYQLFRFLEEFLPAALAVPNASPPHSAWNATRLSALAAALVFVCHPVAVFGAGYLIQRTIVFATFFSLLALRSFVRALVHDDRQAALVAALYYSLAVWSKEHAIMVAPGAVIMALALQTPRRVAVRHAAILLLAGAPMSILQVALRTSFVGAAYEPNVDLLALEQDALPAFASDFERWLLSASTQSALFYKYWALWFWPDVRQMSVDLRIDFMGAGGPPLQWMRLALFGAALPAGLLLLRANSALLRVCGFALGFAALQFLIELGSIRFQEPFVLYRSYLWSPAYMAVFAAVVLLLVRREVTIVAAIAVLVPTVSYLAYDRLETFRSPLALWSDAQRKLPATSVAGAARIHYNVGLHQLKLNDMKDGLRNAEAAANLAPRNPQYQVLYGSALSAIGRQTEAIARFKPHLNDPEGGMTATYGMALALERMGEVLEAKRFYAVAARQQHFGAKQRLLLLEQRSN